MSLYNLRTYGSAYRITKFDPDLNVESTYTVSAKECDCPAGFRSTCRHRQMLPALIPIVDTAHFYNFEGKTYVSDSGYTIGVAPPAATAGPSVSIASYKELAGQDDITAEFDKLIRGSVDHTTPQLIPAPKAARTSTVSQPLRRRV